MKQQQGMTNNRLLMWKQFSQVKICDNMKE